MDEYCNRLNTKTVLVKLSCCLTKMLKCRTFVFIFHAGFPIKVSLSFFHGFVGGYFSIGTAVFDCHVRIAPHTKPALFCGPNSSAQGGLGAWRLKYVFSVLSSPVKTHLHTYFARILKHPTIFSELIKDERQISPLPFLHSEKIMNPSFCIC